MTNEPLQHRSHSQYDTYTQCGERYRLQKIVQPRPPERPAAWLAHGNAFHETYEKWELSQRTIDFLDTYSEIYDRIIAELREVQPDFNLWLKPFRVRKVAEHIATQKERGFEQIEIFLELINGPGWEPWIHEESGAPGVEVPFDIMLGSVRVIGSIDFVREHESGISVLDFKTGNRVEKYSQLGLYGLVMKEEFDLEITHGEYFYSKDCTLSKPIDLSRYTREYLTEIYQTLERGIQNEVFLPNPGTNCGLCSVSEFCREVGGKPIPLDFDSVENPWWAERVDDNQ